MDVDSIRMRVERIRQAAAVGGREYPPTHLHQLRRELWTEVLIEIASRQGPESELAREAMKTDLIDFGREAY